MGAGQWQTVILCFCRIALSWADVVLTISFALQKRHPSSATHYRPLLDIGLPHSTPDIPVLRLPYPLPRCPSFRMLWRRPDSIPVGRIWSRFQGRNGIGQPAMFQVRDLEDKYTSQCLAMMETIFMREEPLSKRLNLKSDRTSINAIIDDWQKYIDQRVSLVCFREEDEEPAELVGFNVVKVKSRGDVEDLGKVEGECWQKIVKVLDATESLADVFKHFGVDKYLTSNGLTVMPQFRGQNIGAKIFEARKPICKAFKLQATATVFTAVSSQVLATKCGFEVLGELPYSVMKSQGVDLDGCETGSAKLMGRKFR